MWKSLRLKMQPVLALEISVQVYKDPLISILRKLVYENNESIIPQQKFKSCLLGKTHGILSKKKTLYNHIIKASNMKFLMIFKRPLCVLWSHLVILSENEIVLVQHD